MNTLQKIIAIANHNNIIYEYAPKNYKEALTPILINEDVINLFKKLLTDGVIEEILPEFMPCVGLEQKNKHHYLTCDNHILKSVEHIAKDKNINLNDKTILCWAMLFHDIGKPIALEKCLAKDFGYHFYNHAKESGKIAKKRLPQLGFINTAEIDLICILIEHHDEFLNLCIDTPDNEYKHKLTPETLKRIIIYVESPKNFELLLKVHMADIMAQSFYNRNYKLKLNKACENMFKKIKKD